MTDFASLAALQSSRLTPAKVFCYCDAATQSRRRIGEAAPDRQDDRESSARQADRTDKESREQGGFG